MRQLMFKSLAVIIAALSCIMMSFAGVAEDTSLLQREWERIKYQTAPAEQERGFARLAQEAERMLAQDPQRAEILIWHGIIVASQAGAKGGLGALSMVKAARQDFEKALEINPQALSGSAYTSLGSLYYQVPGWPLGFGDDNKAMAYLQKGLAINPTGIDPNYFMGDFLFRKGDLDGAERALKNALAAPARPGRAVADDGRRREAMALLEQIAEKRR